MANLTRLAIIRSLEKLLTKRKFESITVKDIVEDCDINRKTFYYYFSDINDLLENAFDFEVNNFFENVEKDMPIEEMVIRLFRTVSSYKQVIYHVYNSGGSEYIENHVGRIIYRVIYDDICKTSENMNVDEQSKEIISAIFAFSISGFIVDWVDGNMKKDPEELVYRVMKITKGMKKFLLSNADGLQQ